MTGVQTCALPICVAVGLEVDRDLRFAVGRALPGPREDQPAIGHDLAIDAAHAVVLAVRRVELHADQVAAPSRNVDLLALDEALDRLASHDRRKAELVKLRFFAGLTIRQAAAALGIAESTADADWAYAKSWLRLELTDPSDQCP